MIHLSKPAKVTSTSEISHSSNLPLGSPRVLFPRPSAPFSGSNYQQISKPKTKSGPIKPPLQQVQQNNVQMEAEEKGQVGAQLRGVFEQVQLLQNSNNYEQLLVCISTIYNVSLRNLLISLFIYRNPSSRRERA